MITVKRKAKFTMAKQRRKSAEVPVGRIPRVARLMALAIRFDRLIRDGVVADQSELARLGHVSRARLTQVMNLLFLAPDIQLDVLFMTAPVCGRHIIAERDLRPLSANPSWKRQRRMWNALKGETLCVTEERFQC